MSNDTNTLLYNEVSDLLPSLTPAQCDEIDGYIREGDLESAQFLLRFLANQYRETNNE